MRDLYVHAPARTQGKHSSLIQAFRCRACGLMFANWTPTMCHAPQASHRWTERRRIRTRDIKREVERLVASSRRDQIAEILRELDREEQ
jgi:hypothetical protein